MIIAERDIAVANRHGDQLFSTVTMPGEDNAPLLLILHGFKGFRNYSFLPWIAQHAAARGMIALRVCFSLNGMNNTSWLCEKPEDFARNTISREVDDVHDLIRAIETDEAFTNVRRGWNGSISLLGHSRGGGVALVAGRELRSARADLLHKVALWNTVGTWTRWTPRQAAAWKELGGIEIQNQRTLQKLTMSSGFVIDIEENAQRLDLRRASESLSDRHRFIHADQDMTVPLKEVYSLVSDTESDSRIQVVQRTTHTFGMTHPVQRITQGFVDALNATFPWIIE